MPRDNSIRGIRILLQSASSSRAFHHTVRNPLPNQSKPRVNVPNSTAEVNAESARRCQVIVDSCLRPRKREDVCAEVAVSIFSPSLPPPVLLPPPFYVTHHLQPPFSRYLSFFLSLSAFLFLSLVPVPFFSSSLFLFWCLQRGDAFPTERSFPGK